MSICTDFFKGLEGQIQLNQIKIRPVETDFEKTRWNQLICEHHYLHDASLCGRQIRYTSRGLKLKFLYLYFGRIWLF